MDLLDEAFPSSRAGKMSLAKKMVKAASHPFDADKFRQSVDSFRESLPNPIDRIQPNLEKMAVRTASIVVSTILFVIFVLVAVTLVILVATHLLTWIAALGIVFILIITIYFSTMSMRNYLYETFDYHIDKFKTDVNCWVDETVHQIPKQLVHSLDVYLS